MRSSTSYVRRTWWAWIGLGLVVGVFAYAACGCGNIPIDYPVPVDPNKPPPPPPPPPPPVTGSGEITDVQFDSIDDGVTPGVDGIVRVGTSEENLVARLGPPYMKRTAAGTTQYTYTIAGGDHVAWFMVAGGKVTRKGKL